MTNGSPARLSNFGFSEEYGLLATIDGVMYPIPFSLKNRDLFTVNADNFISTSTFDRNGWAAFTLPKGNAYTIKQLDINGTGAITEYEIIVSQPNRGCIVIHATNTNWYNCSCSITVEIT